MLEKAKDFLYEIDFFGVSVSLRLDGEPSANTILGGLLSLCLSIGLTVTFFNFAQDLIYKRNPSIATETRYLDQRPNITFSQSELPIAFGISGEGSDYIDAKGLFTLSAEILYNDNTDVEFEMISTPLPVRHCIESDFPMLWKNFGELANGLYCIEDLNATIFGYFDDDDVQYLSIKTSFCNPEIDDECMTKEEIEAEFHTNTYYFNIFFIDTTINLQNYTHPSNRQLFTKYQGMSSYAYKYMEIAMQNQRYETNDILIFDNNISESSIAYQSHDFGETNIGEDLLLFDCMFVSSNIFSIHYRTYQKISDVLANVGGISSVAIFVCEIGCYFFARTRRNEQILNGIFEYDISESSESVKSKLWFNDKFWERQSYMTKNLNCGFVHSENSDELSSKNNSNNNKNMSSVFKGRKTDYKTNTKMFSKEMTNMNQGANTNFINSPINDNFELISIRARDTTKKIIHTSKYPSPIDKELTTYTKSINVLSPSINVNPIKVIDSDNIIDNEMISASDRSSKNKLIKEISSSSSLEYNEKVFSIPEEKISLKKKSSQKTKVTADMVNKIIKMRDKPTQQIHFTFCDILLLYTCRCCARTKAKKMFRLLQKSEPILDELLDIRIFVRKLDELDKLKMVLLSEKQVALFNFISKEMCSLDPEKLKQSEMYNFKRKIRDVNELGKKVIEYIEELGEKGERPKNAIDEKLLNLLHDEVKANVVEDIRNKERLI